MLSDNFITLNKVGETISRLQRSIAEEATDPGAMPQAFAFRAVGAYDSHQPSK